MVRELSNYKIIQKVWRSRSKFICVSLGVLRVIVESRIKIVRFDYLFTSFAICRPPSCFYLVFINEQTKPFKSSLLRDMMLVTY